MRDLQGHQAVAGEVQCDCIPRTHGNRATRRSDGAAVGDLVADQRHVTARCSIYRTPVADAAGTGAAELQNVGVGVGVARVVVQGGGHDAPHVDLSTLAEHHTIRIDQKHLPVGIKLAQNLRPAVAQHPVHSDGRRIGLHEIDAFAAAHVKALPIQGRVLAGLMDGGRATRLVDAGSAGHHLSPQRPCRGGGAEQQR